MKKALSFILAFATANTFALQYNPSASLEENAHNIENYCKRGRALSDVDKSACYNAATLTYQRYIDELLRNSNDYRSGILDGYIQPEYTDKVIVSTHSYTMTPSDAYQAVEYIYEKEGTGLFASLTAHRRQGVKLSEVHGREWKSDIHLITQIAQGFGEKVILQGFSLGGLLSVYEANERPDLVSAYMGMATSFHGGPMLPHSEKSCMARVGFIRKIAEGVSGQNLNDEFILGGCAIFRVSRSITSNSQNYEFRNLKTNTENYRNQFLRAKRNMKNLTMPGVLIYSRADQVVSWQVNRVMSEVLNSVGSNNFYSYEYNENGPRHYGDHIYFNNALNFSGYDGLDFILSKI